MRQKPVIPLVDSLLFLVVIIWAANFTVIKFALVEIPPMGFNTLRFIGSSIILSLYYHFFIHDYAFIWENFRQLIILSLLGNTIMQIAFIYGINSTSASNSSLIYATVPIFVALLSVALKHEKVVLFTWFGIFISFLGIVLVISSKRENVGFSLEHIQGDLLILVTSFCWSMYTVLAKPLIDKSSVMKVVSLTFIIGTVFLIPFGIPDFLRMNWSGISLSSWEALVFSFLFANVLGYIIWFYSVSQVGNVQTAIFQNMIPIFAVIIAVIFLKEKINTLQIAGGIGIICGVTMTRLTTVINNTRKNFLRNSVKNY